ncbi:hypothetical protein BV133_2157 [Blastochloris viridis]|uniref:Uncharacterized protein n=1 Tax=Blastochloris viridis TaxID=1079 RepID=A0A182D2P1_BLAVI|nr:hypothetical protein BV133_2157 [Blastochloris viridis]
MIGRRSRSVTSRRGRGPVVACVSEDEFNLASTFAENP